MKKYRLYLTLALILLMLACDKCGTVQDGATLSYIHITDAERQVLEEIFVSRGGTFPVVL